MDGVTGITEQLELPFKYDGFTDPYAHGYFRYKQPNPYSVFSNGWHDFYIGVDDALREKWE